MSRRATMGISALALLGAALALHAWPRTATEREREATDPPPVATGAEPREPADAVPAATDPERSAPADRAPHPEIDGPGEPSVARTPPTGDMTTAAAERADERAAPHGPAASEPAPEAEGVVRGSLPREAIQGVIREALPELRFCFEWQLALHPELEGRLTMEFVIQPDGTVRDPHVAEDLLDDATVARCFSHVTGALRFPPPDPAGEVAVRYPFVLGGAPPAREPEGI